MKIGIDLDGVVFNTETLWAVNGELYDILELKRNSLNNKKEPKVTENYNWNETEKNTYHTKYLDLPEFDLVPGAKEVLALLKKEKCELIVITARSDFCNAEKYALDKIKKEGIIFDKLYFNQSNKLSTCLSEKIDIMIDDNYHICKEIAKHGIDVLYFHSLNRKHLKGKKITEVYNWGEIYRYIRNYK